MTFLTLQDQLREHIRARIRRRELTGSGLARAAGFPQGHLSNFLNLRRGLSLESMDRLLDALGIGLLDLVAPEEIQSRALPSGGDGSIERVALVAGEYAAQARFAPEQILEMCSFRKSFLRRLRPRDEQDRGDWTRFVVLKVEVKNARAIFPFEMHSTTLLIDRHYVSLEPYRHRQPNLYAVNFGDRCMAGYLSLLGDNLVLRTRDPEEALQGIRVVPGGGYSQFIIGRVCHAGMEL
jgi:transcriptional regulator with XRE-family HTH domain